MGKSLIWRVIKGISRITGILVTQLLLGPTKIRIDITLSARVLSHPPFAQNAFAIPLTQRANENSATAVLESDSSCRKYLLAFCPIPVPSQQLLLLETIFTASNSETSPRMPIHIGDKYGLQFTHRIYSPNTNITLGTQQLYYIMQHTGKYYGILRI